MEYLKPEMVIIKMKWENVITQVSIVEGESTEVPGIDVPEF